MSEGQVAAPAANEQYVIIYAIYRWHGTTREEFKKHYLEEHVHLGKNLPGLVWYATHIVVDEPGQEPDAKGPPRPDAFALMCFENAAAYEKTLVSEAWDDSDVDIPGWVGHWDPYHVDRWELIGQPAGTGFTHLLPEPNEAGRQHIEKYAALAAEQDA